MLKSSLLNNSHDGLVCPTFTCTDCQRAAARESRPERRGALLFTCPNCGAALRDPATGMSPCPTCCHPFDYAKALRHLRRRRSDVREAFGIEIGRASCKERV